MSDNTKIEWSDATWNPVTGCTEVSPGCDHCYAKTFAERWRGTPGHHFEKGFDLTLRPERLDQPLKWRKSRRIFVNSMSDLFHDGVPDDFIARVWAVMGTAAAHTFQILTKRHARLRSLLNSSDFRDLVAEQWERLMVQPPSREQHLFGTWPLPNVWLGVSVEDQKWADIRIPALLDTPAAVRFLSCEPLLGPVDLKPFLWHQCDCPPPGHVRESEHGPRPDWVIVGGESGPGARPMHPDWARSLRDQCVAAGVPYHFKQFGEWAPTGRFGVGLTARSVKDGYLLVGDARDEHGCREEIRRVGKKASGRVLDGRTWDEFPGGAR